MLWEGTQRYTYSKKHRQQLFNAVKRRARKQYGNVKGIWV